MYNELVKFKCLTYNVVIFLFQMNMIVLMHWTYNWKVFLTLIAHIKGHVSNSFPTNEATIFLTICERKKIWISWVYGKQEVSLKFNYKSLWSLAAFGLVRGIWWSINILHMFNFMMGSMLSSCQQYDTCLQFFSFFCILLKNNIMLEEWYNVIFRLYFCSFLVL